MKRIKNSKWVWKGYWGQLTDFCNRIPLSGKVPEMDWTGSQDDPIKQDDRCRLLVTPINKDGQIASSIFQSISRLAYIVF